jgi:hypothetical protein
MDTLMRTLTLLALGVLLAMGAARPVNAQTPTADGSRFLLNVNFGGQWNERTFTDTSTFNIYNESGALASAHAIGGGTLFDVAVGARRVWRRLSVGIAYSTITNRNDATVSAAVPHPLVFGQPRTATATASDLKHSESAVHLQFMWPIPIPLSDRFELTAMVGPSFFTVRQTVATLQAPQEQISDPAPFTSPTINSISLTDVKDSPMGVNVGVDGIYWIRTLQGVGQALGMSGIRIGVGGFLRYAGASLDLETPAGVTRDTDLKTGGPQGALGLRLRF